MNPQVDDFFSNINKWKKELEYLRMIALDCNLTEEFKWQMPCYAFQKSNIAMLGNFKEYCALSFFKGALLKDENCILDKPGKNTQSARIIRFTDLNQIIEMEPMLKALILEAIEVEKSGVKVDFKKIEEFTIPEEFEIKMNEIPALKSAFEALTPGRQRAYIMYFSDSKQSKTRESRIEKYMQRILDGKGINDCVCGLSKRMPGCDGSHKMIK